MFAQCPARACAESELNLGIIIRVNLVSSFRGTNPVAFSSDIFWGEDRMSVPLTFDRFLGAQRMNQSNH